MPKHSSVILATRFCTSKYFKSIFFTYFHKPIAGPLPTRHFLPPDSFCHHHGEKICQKSSIFEKYLQISFTALVHSNFLHLCCCPFWGLKVEAAGKYERQDGMENEKENKGQHSGGRGPADALPLLLPRPHFRHICLSARTFCYIEKAARNCAKMLILFAAAPFRFAGAKNGKNAPLLFLLLICF